MKKSRLLMIAPAIAMLLTACGETPEPSTNTDTAPKGGIITEEVTIDLWHTFNDEYTAVLKNFVEAFKTIEPKVTVKLTKQSGNYDQLKDKITKGFSADNYPDLAICYPDHVAEYIDYGKAVQLDDYMDNADYGWTAQEKADMNENYLNEGQSYTVDGTYSLPFAKSTEAMFYNKTALAELDLSSVDPTINGGNPLSEAYLNNLTWEELFEKLCPAIIKYNDKQTDANKIYKPDGEFHGIFGYDSDDNLFITLAQQYGYPYTGIDKATGVGTVDFNTAEMKALMKKFNDARQKDYIVTKGVSGDYVNKLFADGKTLFSVGSTGGTKHQYTENFEVGVAKIPHAKDRDPYVINQGPSLCVLSHADENRILASWLFYKFATSTHNATVWGIETSYMPVRYSCYTTPEYLAYSDVDLAEAGADKLFAKVATYNPTVQNDLFVSAVFKGSSTCRVQSGSIMTQVLKEADLTDAKLDKIFSDAVDLCKLAL